MISQEQAQMDAVEQALKEVVRRIKTLEESPDPRAVRAAKLRLELQKEKFEATLDNWRRGVPIADGHFTRLFKAMGFAMGSISTEYTHYGGPCFPEYSATAERAGFPASKLCEQIVVELGMLGKGNMAKPDVLIVDTHGCDSDHQYFAECEGNMLNIPTFYIDLPLLQDDELTVASVSYVADQLGDFIEWAESKIPGVKYDESRLIEMLEYDAIGDKYERECHQLIKHFPCPVSPVEVLSKSYYGFQASRLPNMQKAVEYYRIIRDDLAERVAKGTGPYPEERLRLLWAGAIPDLDILDYSKLLLERKVAVPGVAKGHRCRKFSSRSDATPYGELSEHWAKLSPLQKEAAIASMDWWGGPGKRWVNHTLDLAGDIGAQGIIHFNLIGCTPMNNMGTVVADRAEKELGIPTLNFIGRYLDPDYMSQKQFEEILSPFIDKCFDRAGKPRQ